MRDGDQRGRAAQRVGERVQVEGAVGGARQHLDLDAARVAQLEQVQRRADIAGGGGEDPIAGPQRQRVQGSMPGDRRALGEGDVVRADAEQLPGERVDLRGLLGGGLRGLVPADPGLETQVLDHRAEHGLAGQGGPGRVQVPGVPGAGGSHSVDGRLIGHSAITTPLDSVNACRASSPRSRPRPESPTPPKESAGSKML